MLVFSKGCLRYLLREYESLSYSLFNVKHCKERKRKISLALIFRLAVNVLQPNLRFKKAQQLTVSRYYFGESIHKSCLPKFYKLLYKFVELNDEDETNIFLEIRMQLLSPNMY
jgi:hypothetical protein